MSQRIVLWKATNLAVILGTGYELSYGTYQFLNEAVETNNSKVIFREVLEYASNQIKYFEDVNQSRQSQEVRFMIPSKLLFERVQNYFENEIDQSKLKVLTKVFDTSNTEASHQYFTIDCDDMIAES